eukprot:5464941-Pleurochrysis_carterae.AAC.1
MPCALVRACVRAARWKQAKVPTAHIACLGELPPLLFPALSEPLNYSRALQASAEGLGASEVRVDALTEEQWAQIRQARKVRACFAAVNGGTRRWGSSWGAGYTWTQQAYVSAACTGTYPPLEALGSWRGRGSVWCAWCKEVLNADRPSDDGCVQAVSRAANPYPVF